jgi:2-haloacid dehalogenase
MSIILKELKDKKFMTFDCYGTLIDWETGIVKLIKPLLKQKGIEITSEEILRLYSELESNAEKGDFVDYKTILRKVTADLFSKLKIEPTKDEKEILINGFRRFEPFPDTIAALERLGKKFDLGIISNVDKDIFNYTVKKLSIDIHNIFTSESVKSYKPSLEVFRFALKKMNAKMDEVIHVAQSIYHDITPANKMGITTVLVNRSKMRGGFGAVPKVEPTFSADFVVKDLKTLVNLLGFE